MDKIDKYTKASELTQNLYVAINELRIFREHCPGTVVDIYNLDLLDLEDKVHAIQTGCAGRLAHYISLANNALLSLNK